MNDYERQIGDLVSTWMDTAHKQNGRWLLARDANLLAPK